MNILVIAGYDVLADKIPVHREYVEDSFWRAYREEIDLIFTIGGTTNPDYPELTEAEANFRILKEEFLDNSKVFTPFRIKVLPTGNTSAETLQAVKEYLEKERISVNKLVICAEQSRITGFLVDALHVGLLDLSKQIVACGYPFPESKDNFNSQRKKMPMKILSHRSKMLCLARKIYQKSHQRKVARQKRKEKK